MMLTVVGFASCLKQDPNLNPKESNDVVEIFNQVPGLIASDVTDPYPLYVETFPISAGETFEVTVNYAGAGNAPQDINVKLGLDAHAIDEYNDSTSNHYILLPASKYTIDTWDVTIPKGQKKATATFKLKTETFDFAEAYALPVKIMSTSFGKISGNYGTTIFSVGAKNPYDGIYQYTTSANTSLQPNKNLEIDLITQSLTKVKMGAPGLLASYTNEVFYIVNPTTNAITVECASLGVQTPQDTRSKYDPATRTLTVFWKQGNGGRTFEEKFVYKRER